jgi:hypothetical protein
MVLDLYNPIARAIYIASKIYKINYNSVKASLWDNRNNRRFVNSLSCRVINTTPTNDFRNIIKSDFIVLFKDNFISLSATY